VNVTCKEKAMKKWAFVSDFDGTISDEDFYWLVIHKYYPEGKELFQKWKAAEILDIDFLRTVFSSIHQSEEQIIEDILSIPIDPFIPEFIKEVQNNQGDFYVLSAGTDYYIHHLLMKHQVENVKVISNPGYYEKQNIHLTIDSNHRHYSKRYGIDKSVVIKELLEEYDEVYFAGDSEPDSHPAAFATITFAKKGLQAILLEKQIPYVPIDTFNDVRTYLQTKGVLSTC
jgi:2-hydroxy-3-keto-5-methylthiopentenyl-1-phosphate phosphatase